MAGLRCVKERHISHAQQRQALVPISWAQVVLTWPAETSPGGGPPYLWCMATPSTRLS